MERNKYYKYLRVSKSWTRELGWTEQEMTANTWEHFVHVDDVEPARRRISDRMSGLPIPSPVLVRMKCKDGSFKNVEWTTISDSESSKLLGIGIVKP